MRRSARCRDRGSDGIGSAAGVGLLDAHTAAWLAGEDPLTGNLSRWFRSYEGTGRGAVTRDGFVEPYQGDLLGREEQPRVVILGLNPGQYFPDLQSRQGLFAAEIKQAGSYSDWVRDHPGATPLRNLLWPGGFHPGSPVAGPTLETEGRLRSASSPPNVRRLLGPHRPGQVLAWSGPGLVP